MSKSKGTGVFIDVPPKDLYGQIMAQPDEMIEVLFVRSTLLPLEEIKKILKQNPKEAKMRLALEITKVFHGERKAKEAEDNFIKVFQDKKQPDEIEEFKVQKSKINIIDLLCMSNLAESKSEAKRLIEQKGIKINGKILEKEKEIEIGKGGIVIQRGGRRFRKIII